MKVRIKSPKVKIKFQCQRVHPTLENLVVKPTNERQVFNHPDSYGYDEVIVERVHGDELIVKPTTEEQINEGVYSKVITKPVTADIDDDIKPEYIKKGRNILGVDGGYEGIDTSDATATSDDVLVGKVAYAKNQKLQGTIEEYDGSFEGSATIEGNATLLTEPSTGSKIHYLIQKIPTINFSGLTNVANFFDGCLNLEEVSLVNTSRLNIINYLFYNCQKLTKIIFPEKPNISQMISAFNNCGKLESVENINTSNCNFFSETFSGCNSLKECPDINTNNATNVYGMFKSCMNLITIPKLYFGKVIRIDYLLNSCSSLQNLGGFEEIGKAFTTKTVNYSFYILDLSSCTKLTHDSLMNVINNLYDLNLTYNVANGGTLYTQTLKLGATNLAKLTAEEIAIATNKGWTVS